MNKFLAAGSLTIFAACLGGNTEPVNVMVNGVEGIRVLGGAMLGTEQPTPENIQVQSERIKNGTHGAGLNRAAARYCPDGYRILQEDAPEAKIYVFQPLVQYKVYQSFVIACT
jgi:hypothetical protein